MISILEREQVKTFLKDQLFSYTDNCPNFSEIHRNYNLKFNQESKTLPQLKKEVLEIASQEKYQVLTRQELARQKEAKILEYGQKNILKPDWESFSETEKIPVDYCRNKFADLLPLSERNQLAFKELSVSEKLEKALQEYQYQCSGCQKYYYDSNPALWKNQLECFGCNRKHQQEIQDLFDRVDQHLEEGGKTECLCCGLVRNQETKWNFHLDHINIFDKSDSVCSMVRNGDSWDLIREEVDKCQVLCKPCHHIVTKLEQILGYTQLKTKITKELIDDQSDKYQKLYQNQFEYLYQKIKELTSN